ncbi:hypothetical protein ACJMK2_034478 [Sinanodonta woodiana]|uniref:Dynein assembly factor 5, axonemal n=1 Tax=Sinanodonta woodiana TaxID=1069815 RepID=A0ABD3WRS1_SINWO
MASTDVNSNAVLQGIARQINCLDEENKMSRRRALESIRKETIARKPPLETSELKPLFNELLKPLLKGFSDPVEKCRELSVQIIREFLKVVPDPVDSLPYIMPLITQRLGQQDITEPSEEVRLELVELLVEIVEFSRKDIAVYLEDMIRILQRTIVDPYPEVKKTSCSCAAKLGKSIPEYFYHQSEHLIKPLLQSISHQHSRVRTVVIETIGEVIQYGHGKSVDTVVSHLAQRLFDQTPAVRVAVTRVVGNWLLDLPDRYSFHHKLIPLLLTSIRDEQPEIRELADSLWHDIGLKYQQENEEELKDKIDFAKPVPIHYPPKVERPNLGCRILMFRNVSRILPGLMKDVVDWVLETRIKSASLLYMLLLNSEEYITQHMEILLSGMYKACADEDQRVTNDIQKAAELIGYFVEPEVWCRMIISYLKSSQSYTGLMVLSPVIYGSERTKLRPYLSTICDTITLPDICHSLQPKMQINLLSCVESLITVSKEDLVDTCQSLFNLLHTILAIQQGEVIKEKAYKMLDELALTLKFGSKQELYRTCTKPLLDSFQETYTIWNTHSVERLIMDTLLQEAGPVVGDHLDEIMKILVVNLKPEKDAEVRLKFFSLLSQLMMNSKVTIDSSDKFGDFAVMVVKDMIIPNCVWKAGRVAEAIRTTAVSCMWALLKSGILTKEKLEPVVDELLTQMISLLDDSNKTTRLVTCRVLTRIFDLMGTSIDQDRLHTIYLDLLKRLDDSNDEIRVTVAKTFLAYIDCFTKPYDAGLYRAHLETLYRGLLIHLDDPEPKIQEAILGVLTKAGSLKPTLMLEEVENVKHKHRSRKYCDELMQKMMELKAS